MEEIPQKAKELSETILAEKRPYRSQPRYKNIVHLWEFLLELLAEENCRSLITWIRKDFGEFKLQNPEGVAKRWGMLKGKQGMNYGKLSRALRYYYQQGIIIKVPGQRLVYKFNKLPYKYEPGMKESLYRQEKMIENFNDKGLKEAKTVPRQMIPANPSRSAFIPASPPLGKYWTWPFKPMPSRSLLWYPSSSFLKPRISGGESRLMFGSASSVASLHVSREIRPVHPVYPVYNKFHSSAVPVPISIIHQIA